MNEISFQVSAEDRALIQRIAHRALEIDRKINGLGRPLVDWVMDISAVHANGCALDLAKLLAFPDFDFVHDVFGIERHLNRQSGHLGGCFSPRSAVQ